MSNDPVKAEETLSRYILQSNHLRKTDNTVKPDAFVPHPHEDLSVTRHLDLAQDAIWEIGQKVADQRNKTLYGLAQNQAQTFFQQKLKIFPAPILPDNPNHANVIGWPQEKELQKILALEIASESSFLPR